MEFVNSYRVVSTLIFQRPNESAFKYEIVQSLGEQPELIFNIHILRKVTVHKKPQPFDVSHSSFDNPITANSWIFALSKKIDGVKTIEDAEAAAKKDYLQNSFFIENGFR